jgi:uncharacterized membrane protein YwzB
MHSILVMIVLIFGLERFFLNRLNFSLQSATLETLAPN